MNRLFGGKCASCPFKGVGRVCNRHFSGVDGLRSWLWEEKAKQEVEVRS